MVVLENVSKHYSGKAAVTSVSFSAEEGEILGLLGPNGAGKTSILRILTGYHFPSSGKVMINGLDIFSHTEEIQASIGYVAENAPLYSELTVDEFLRFSAGARLSGSAEQSVALNKAVSLCTLESVLHRPVSQLSKGYRQRVALAQAILHDPPILILDEPTSGLDPIQIQDFRELITALGKSKTIILSSHIMQEVEALCDRVIILNQGVIIAQGDTRVIGEQFRGGKQVFCRFNRGGEGLLSKLQAMEAVKAVRIRDNGFELDMRTEDEPGELLFDFCIEQNLKLRELSVLRVHLNEIFSRLASEGSSGRGERS